MLTREGMAWPRKQVAIEAGRWHRGTFQVCSCRESTFRVCKVDTQGSGLSIL